MTNFGTLKASVIREVLGKILEGDGAGAKRLLSEFSRAVKSDDTLLRLFFVFENLESATILNDYDAKLFVAESMKTLDGCDFRDITLKTNLLALRLGVPTQGMPSSEIHESIFALIKVKTSTMYDKANLIKVQGAVVEQLAKEKVSPSINKSETSERPEYFSPKFVVKRAVAKFNSAYSKDLIGEDLALFQTLRTATDSSLRESHDRLLSRIREDFSEEYPDDIKNSLTRAIEIFETTTPSVDTILNMHILAEELGKV